MSKTLTNMERSAALIMSLDEDSAAEVFKFLSAQEIQRLSATMTNMPQVTQEQMARRWRNSTPTASSSAPSICCLPTIY